SHPTCEPELLAPVHFGAPQFAVGIGDIGYPLSVARKTQVLGRHSSQKRDDLPRCCVIASQLGLSLFTGHKDLLARPAGNGAYVVQRPCRQQHGLSAASLKPAGPFPDSPDALFACLSRTEQEVPAI